MRLHSLLQRNKYGRLCQPNIVKSSVMWLVISNLRLVPPHVTTNVAQNTRPSSHVQSRRERERERERRSCLCTSLIISCCQAVASRVHHLEALGYVDRTHIVCCYLAMCMPGPSLGCLVHTAWQLRAAWFVQPSSSGLYPSGLVLYKPYRTDCHAISLKWPIKISAWCIHFVRVANQIHEELENGRPFQISYFALCMLYL